MKSRLEHVLGFDLAPASCTAKRLVVSAATPSSGAKGYACGCLWVSTPRYTGSAYLHVNAGSESSANWVNVVDAGVARVQSDIGRLATVVRGSGPDLPNDATVGQIFVKNSNPDPGLYVCTAVSQGTRSWKNLSLES